MAGVEDGFVVVLRALIQAVAARFAVPHLEGTEETTVLRDHNRLIISF